MKKLIKITSSVLAGLMILSMIGCGSSATEPAETPAPAASGEPAAVVTETASEAGTDTADGETTTEAEGGETADASAQVVLVRFDSPITGVDQLPTTTIGVQAGSDGATYVSAHYADTTVKLYKTSDEAVEALLAKDVDAVVIDSETANAAVDADDNLDVLKEALPE